MYRSSPLVLIFLFLSCIIVSVGLAADKIPPSDAFRLMADAADKYFSAGIKEISAEELWNELNDADTTQPYLISVRQLADDTVRGHIPGAHHWDPADVIRHYDQLPKNKKIVIYCYTGQSSSLCTAFLNLIGFDAYNLRWGLCAWTTDTSQIGMGGGWYHPAIGNQKLETERHPMTANYSPPEPKVASGSDVVDLFCANIEPQAAQPTSKWKMKSAADVYANIEDSDPANDWCVLFYGAKSVYDAGHVPGSYLIEPGTGGLEENLKHLPPDKPIVVYCLNGHASMQVVTLLNALGYDAYSLKRGLNTITDREELLGTYKWVPGKPDYPLVRGSLPVR